MSLERLHMILIENSEKFPETGKPTILAWSYSVFFFDVGTEYQYLDMIYMSLIQKVNE
jgi:hypothetical protein